jgi:hypothetical protein
VGRVRRQASALLDRHTIGGGTGPDQSYGRSGQPHGARNPNRDRAWPERGSSRRMRSVFRQPRADTALCAHRASRHARPSTQRDLRDATSPRGLLSAPLDPAMALESSQDHQALRGLARKPRPRCPSSSNRGSNLPCTRDERRRRLHSANSWRPAQRRNMYDASACCKALRIAHARTHRLLVHDQQASAAPLQTLRTRVPAWFLGILRYRSNSLPWPQCSVLSARLLGENTKRAPPYRVPAPMLNLDKPQ